MGSQRFDSMTQVAAGLPDRRNMLKVVAAAALTGVAGTAFRTEEGSAMQGNNNNNRRNNRNRQRGLVNVAITDLLNNLTINIPVKNNNIAAQICAAVELIDVELLTLSTLRCEIEQEQ